MEECCGTCGYYNPGKDGQGECRRWPPTLLLMPPSIAQSPVVIGGRQAMLQQQAQLLSHFPPVKASVWCGEHRTPEELASEEYERAEGAKRCT